MLVRCDLSALRFSWSADGGNLVASRGFSQKVTRFSSSACAQMSEHAACRLQYRQCSIAVPGNPTFATSGIGNPPLSRRARSRLRLLVHFSGVAALQFGAVPQNRARCKRLEQLILQQQFERQQFEHPARRHLHAVCGGQSGSHGDCVEHARDSPGRAPQRLLHRIRTRYGLV